MAKIVIWGVGVRGKRIASRLSEDDVVAFIDSDYTKIGNNYNGKKIIDLKEYMEHYSNYFILISPLYNKEIKEILDRAEIYQYFELRRCPSELEGIGRCEAFNEYVSIYEKGKSYGIYGTTFYSIYAYEKLYLSGCHDLFLIPEKNADIKKIKKIQDCYDFVKIIPDCDWKKYIDEIYVTVDRVDRYPELVECGLPIIEHFDFMHIIPEYRNPEWKKFKDVNKGDSCFIIATGPSLRMEDLDVLHRNHVKTIGVNRIYLAFDKTNWKPDYYVVTDQYCISESENEIKSLPVTSKFVSDLYPGFWKENVPDNIYKYHSASSMTPGKLPEYSEDLEYGTYGSGTVTYEAIQIATYLGFKKIYLLGVDFNFSKDYKSAKNHFSDNYYNEESKTAIFAKDESLLAYKSAKKYADEHGIKIYNATRGGKLEVFERVDFDSLFKE